MPLQQRPVAGRPPGGVESDQIERRRIGRAVVGRVRDQLEMGELAVAHLVQDLPGLSVTVVVPILGLKRAQDVERAAGEVWIDQQVLQRNDQAVPAERGDKPRQAGGRQENQVIRADDRQA